MKNKIKIFGAIILILILIFAVYSIMFLGERDSDEGEYDYCVEWVGFGGGTLKRSNLLYTCYSLASRTFFCDYEIMEDKLMVKQILNVTKDEEGFITQINYEQPNYFNCTRWLKSRR